MPLSWIEKLWWWQWISPKVFLLRLDSDSCTHSQLPLHCHGAKPDNRRKFPLPLLKTRLILLCRRYYYIMNSYCPDLQGMRHKHLKSPSKTLQQSVLLVKVCWNFRCRQFRNIQERRSCVNSLYLKQLKTSRNELSKACVYYAQRL